MANSDKNILITPNISAATGVYPSIKFNGANNTPINLNVLDDGTTSFSATSGQLFSISDTMSGSIFSVNDISGVPSIEILDTGLIKLNQYGGSSVFGGSSAIQSGTTNSKISVYTVLAGAPGIIVRGASSQSANLQEWQNSSGTLLSSIKSDGGFYMPNSSTFNPKLQIANFFIDGFGATYTMESVTIGSTSDSSRFASGGLTIINRGGASNVPFGVQGSASQTADLTQWRNSAGSTLMLVDAYGRLGINTTSLANSTGGYSIVSIYNNNTVNTNLVIKSYPSQTANLQEWQNSSGTVLASISSNGTVYMGSTGSANIATFYNGTSGYGAGAIAYNGIFNINGANIGFPYTSSGAVLAVNATHAGAVPLTSRAYASQTADLQQWQNSAGTVLAKVDSNGNLSAKGLSVSSVINTTNAGTFYNAAGTIVFNVDTSLNQVNIGGGLSGVANNFGSSWGYDSLMNAGFITFQTGALGGDSLAMRRTNFISSGDYTISTLGNMRLSVASGKNFNFNNGNIMIATTASGTNNKIIVNPYTTVDNLATVQINTNAVTNKGLVVQGVASQSANLQEWQNSAGTVLSRIDGAGSLISETVRASVLRAGNWASLPSGTVAAFSTCTTASTVGFIVKAATSQTANLQEWQNSDGSVLGYITSNGHLNINELNGATSLQYGNSFGVLQTKRGIIALAGVSNNPAISIFGADSPTADLMTWGKSNGDIIGGITANAGIYTNLQSASQVGLIVKGAASQTANLQQWQNSSGTVLANVSSGGAGTFNALTLTSGNGTFTSPGWSGFGTFGPSGGTSGVTLGISPYIATNTALVVRGYTSQTANLQEWQNSSGTVLSRITSSGQLAVPNIYSVNGSGAFITMNSTSGAVNINTNAAANIGIIVRATASQTANLQEWQDSSGTVLSSITNNGFLNIPAILENPTISATAATGTINYDLLTNKSVTYYTSNASANWTLNIRGNSTTTLDSLMAVGQSLTIVFMATQGTTAYYQSGFQIDGTSVTPKWQGGAAPTFGNASGVDAYSITIMKTASATFSVFESQTRFA